MTVQTLLDNSTAPLKNVASTSRGKRWFLTILFIVPPALITAFLWANCRLGNVSSTASKYEEYGHMYTAVAIFFIAETIAAGVVRYMVHQNKLTINPLNTGFMIGAWAIYVALAIGIGVLQHRSSSKVVVIAAGDISTNSSLIATLSRLQNIAGKVNTLQSTPVGNAAFTSAYNDLLADLRVASCIGASRTAVGNVEDKCLVDTPFAVNDTTFCGGTLTLNESGKCS